MNKPQKVYFLTVILWLMLVVCHAAWFVISILSGPPSPDLYANNWVFQIVVFVIFRFPVWLVLILVLLFVEFRLIGRQSTEHQKAKRIAPNDFSK